MILRPSSVSVSIPPASSAGGEATGGGVSSRITSGVGGLARIREVGGRIVRFTDSSGGTRFGFGTCGSINETLSTVCFGRGAGAGSIGGAVLAGVFRAVMGAKADFGATTGAGLAAAGDALIVVAAPPSLVAATFSSLVGLELLAGLAAVRERD